MALFAWESKYSVGVDEMDRQHKVLFNIMNDLHEAMMQGKARAMTGGLLQKLLDYTRKHFAAEEAILSAARYTALAEHRRKHKDLMMQVDEYVARYQRGENAVNVQLLNFLRDWLTTHIQQTDRQYGSSASAYLCSKARGAA